jgi:alpha-N-arabinofuranosidase
MNVINATIRQVTTCVFHNLSYAPHMKSPKNPPFRLVSRRVLFGLAALSAGLVFTSQVSAADPGKIVVQVDKPGAKISPTFYGLMTEEINYSYDGGLYGELIQNRIFKNPPPRGGRGRGGPPEANTPAPAVPAIPHWSVVHSEGAQGEISLDTNNPVNTVALTTSLKLDITSVAPGGRVGVANDGYWGIPTRPYITYQASFYAKGSGGFTGPLTVDIESNDGATIHVSATVPKITDAWEKYNVTLKTGPLDPSAGSRFVISGAAKGTVHLNLVSLFPPTYKNRPNGNRLDISQLLADMKPAFLRFPGGNYVEGSDYANRWDWPRTIGPLEERPTHNSPWGYRSTDGMGLLEYLEWCEDLNMEPVLAVFAAYTLNGQSYTGEYARFAQEAVDEIEYAIGDVNTKWGAQRAKDGHPAPFKLTYVEIGNEDPAGGRGGQPATYAQRFAIFYLTIKAKYPNLQIISTTRNGFGNYPPDVIDEHYYMNFNSALNNAHMYDNRPRTNQLGAPVPRIFVGEWATRDNNPTPSFHCALTDAAFLTGLERNADLVIMSCYAPLFVNVNPGGQQWATDLIGYDTMTAFGSPSYYVQKMFYNNKGDVVLPISLTPQIEPASAAINAAPAGGPGGFGGRGRGPSAPTQTMFASSSLDETTGDVILKVINAVETPQQVEISLEGAPKLGNTARMEVLTGGLTDVNSVSEPMKVAPKSSTIAASAKFVREFPGNTVTVIRFSTK